MEGFLQCLPAFGRRVMTATAFLLFSLPATATSLERAKRIHDRLAGVPPSASVLNAMETLVTNGDAIGAAELAMQNKGFYNATLKNWITPWTNRDDDKFAPLNDYTATVIGVIRDGADYRRILYDNILYVGAVAGPVSTGYSVANNANYLQLEANDVDLGNSALLVATTQSGVPPQATAGVMTTRAAARALFSDGTNRAMFRYTLKNHLCHDLEQVQDSTRPTERIRRDISRSPGGDSRIFMNNCSSCHTGMDPLAQAFAYYNFAHTDGSEDAGQIEYTANSVQPKYRINENHFIEGYDTPDDRWDDYWRSGPNTAIFGW